MTTTVTTSSSTLSPEQVQSAIRLTYGQMMLNAVFGASTGGMFLIGFALSLGASDMMLGVLSSLPMFCVVFQIGSAYLLERGASYKRVTVVAAFIAPLCWLFIAAIPFGAAFLSHFQQLILLVAIVMLVTIVNQFAGNARGSWIGELIPADKRSRFFASCALFAGVVSAFFSIVEGRFLDFIKNNGVYAFAGLFFFGALFGVISAFLNLPQPDCPVQRSNAGGFRQAVVAVRHNRPLMRLLGTVMVMSLGTICSPFVSAYCLRDVGMSYFGLGCVNSVTTIFMLIFSPFFGRLVGRIGGRPVLIAGLALFAPLGLVWMFIPPGRADLAYIILPLNNVVSGCILAGINIAFATLLYKMTTAQGRAVQLAVYTICATLTAAPMPLIGGWMVTTLRAHGFDVDVRLTFYLWTLFTALAALMACRISEPGSISTRVLVFDYIPQWLTSMTGTILSLPEQLLGALRRDKDE